MVPDDTDEDLKDQVLSDEIALLGDIMLAVGGAVGLLSFAEIDRALGLPNTEDDHD